jgi:hypothetical protein
MPKRHNAKGRSTSERYVRLPHWMLNSPAWRSLSPIARCVLIELLSIYNGSNNGFIAMSARTAAERVGCVKDTAARAFRELQDKGFIEVSIVGAFHRKTPHATEYRLALYPCHRTNMLAANTFMKWRPPANPFSRSDEQDSRSDYRDSNGPFRNESA